MLTKRITSKESGTSKQSELSAADLHKRARAFVTNKLKLDDEALLTIGEPFTRPWY